MKQAKLTKKNYNIIRFLILILALAAIGCIVFFRGIEGSKNTIDENEDMQNIDNNTFINFTNNEDSISNNKTYENNINNNIINESKSDNYENNNNKSENNNNENNKSENYNYETNNLNSNNQDLVLNSENNVSDFLQNMERIQIEESEIVDVQTKQYEEGIRGSYLSWEELKIDTNSGSLLNLIDGIEEKSDILNVTKVAKTKTGKNFATPGEEITYIITIENVTKKNNFQSIEVKDKIPEKTSFVSAENGIPVKDETGNVVGVRWNAILNKETNYIAKVRFTVKVDKDAKGTIKNSEAYANGIKSNETKTSIIICSKESKVKNKKEGEPAEVGDIISYTIKLENTGEIEGSTYVKDNKLVDLIYDGILTLYDENGLELNGKNNAQDLLDGKNIDLKPYETKEIQFDTRVLKISNEIINSLVVKEKQNTGNPENLQNYPQNTTNTADILVKREILNKKEEAYKLGEEIIYKITVTNIGSVNLKNIQILDIINDEEVNLENSGIINKLTNGESKKIIYTYIVKEKDLGKQGKEGKVQDNICVTADIENSLEKLQKQVEGEVPTEIKIVKQPEINNSAIDKPIVDNPSEPTVDENVTDELNNNNQTSDEQNNNEPNNDELVVDKQPVKCKYTIKYIYENYEEKSSKHTALENVEITKQDITGIINENNKTGFKFEYSSIDENALKITKDEKLNIITIYYVKDETVQKDLQYTVKYYKDNNLVEQDTYTVKEKIWINSDENKLSVNEIDTSNNRYSGYNFEKTYPETIPEKIEDGSEIKIYYTKKDTTVLVHYYIEGTEEKLANDIVITGKIQDEYKTNTLENVPNKYELTKVPENSKGTMQEEQIVVTYWYKIKNAKEMQISKAIYKNGTNEEISKAEIGDIITLEVEILNENDVELKTTLTETLPQGITPIESTVLNGVTNENNQIIWENITIPNGRKKITYNAKIEDNVIGLKDLTITSSITNIGEKITTQEAKLDIEEITIKKIQTQLGIEQTGDVNIILVMDLSNSMNGETKEAGVTRIEAAKTAVQTFIKDIYEDENSKIKEFANIKLITFNAKDPIYSYGRKIAYSGTQLFGTANKNNYASLNSKIADISYYNTGFITHMGAALTLAKNNLENNKKNILVFLSDGAPYYQYKSGGRTITIEDNTPDVIRSLASEIRAAGAEIYSIGFGTEAGNETSEAYGLLSDMSSNGEVATSNSTLELSANFKEIFKNINVTSTVKTQNGIITIYTDNLILNNNEYPISATFTNANGVEQQLFSITNSNTEFGLTYDGEKLVWDVSIWNSLKEKTHITDERFTIKFYVTSK